MNISFAQIITLVSISLTGVSHASSLEPELVLAGGALALCSSLSPNQCNQDALPIDRSSSKYSLADKQRTFALAQIDSLFDQPTREQIASDVGSAHRSIGPGPHSADRLSDAFDRLCTTSDCAWSHLNDEQRAAVLSALELGQFDSQEKRLPERVSLAGSKDPSGPQILRHFVARAALRSAGKRPRIALVTASGFDPFDAVDYYLGALDEAGADALWWPIDAALAATVFGDGDCEKLPARHASLLGLPDRSKVFPDRVIEQLAWCRSKQAASLPDDIQGVFFAGGDQWKLRRALFDGDQANPWMTALRRQHATGNLVVAGTSAGTAVQSGPGMISNGSPRLALRSAPHQAVPPEPGCTRNAGCGGLEEDAFTVWPAGGTGLTGPFLMDTHFSERAREWRLMRALAAGPAKAGIGVDETSAVHMTQHADQSWTVAAMGRSGAWLFETRSSECGHWRGQASYLSAGSAVRWSPGKLASESAASVTAPTRTPPTATPTDDDPAFGEGAIRLGLQPLAGGARSWTWRAEGALLSFDRTSDTQHIHSPERPPTVLRLEANLRFIAACGSSRPLK